MADKDWWEKFDFHPNNNIKKKKERKNVIGKTFLTLDTNEMHLPEGRNLSESSHARFNYINKIVVFLFLFAWWLNDPAHNVNKSSVRDYILVI